MRNIAPFSVERCGYVLVVAGTAAFDPARDPSYPPGVDPLAAAVMLEAFIKTGLTLKGSVIDYISQAKPYALVGILPAATGYLLAGLG